MRSIVALLLCAAVSFPVYGKNTTQTYWLLERGDWHTWCGYASVTDFKAEAARLRPTDTIRVEYSSGKLIALTYQIESESGDWIVIDRYTPTENGLLVKRANLLVQPALEIIQEAHMHDGKAQPFRVLSVKTLGKKKRAANVNLSKIDYPPIKVMTNLSAMPFMGVISEMRKQGIQTLCKRVG